MLRSPIASGGMAEVWQGEDQILGRQVAVKVLHRHLATDPTFVERFRSEARLAARLSHPGIVSIFDTVSEPDLEAIVMELLEGIDLRSFLDEHGTLDPPLAKELGVQVAAALHHAHVAGLVHRDIKPANIMLVDDRRMKVTDFGIAKPTDSPDLTDHGSLVGTAKYLAPEQVNAAPVDGRTDVYSLGIVLFEALSGQPPFAGDSSYATALARLTTEPPRVREVKPMIPHGLDEIILRAMQRDPEDRFEDAAAMRAALIAADDAVVATDFDVDNTIIEASVATPPDIIASERRWLVPAMLILVVALCLGVAGALIGTTDFGRSAVDRAKEAVGFDPSPTTAPEPDEGTEIGEPAEIVGITTFDPGGSGTPGENDGIVSLAIDSDPATAWRTEGYSQRDFGQLKPGVGVIVELSQRAPVQSVEIESPTQGWAVEIYLGDESFDSLERWGSPVTTADGIDGNVRLDLGGPEARFVLVWITDVGDGPPRIRAELAEIVIVAGE